MSVGILAVATHALAGDNGACVASYEQGQLDRRQGHFDAARTDFATCTADACPSLVRERCLQFARELELAQPTIIVVVHDGDGHDAAAVRVSVDGGTLAPLPATVLRLDPGEHLLRVEAEAGNAEQRIVLREGEKERRLEILVGQKTRPTQPAIEAPVGPVAPPSKPVASWAFTVVAGVSLLGAGALSATGWGIYSDLSSSCHHACTDDQVASLRVVWPTAFVALGVGVVTGIVAAVLFATRPRQVERALLQPSGVAWRF